MTDAQASYLKPCPNKHNKLLTIRNDLTKAEASNSLTRCAKRLGSNRSCRRKSRFAKGGRDTMEGSGKKKKGSGQKHRGSSSICRKVGSTGGKDRPASNFESSAQPRTLLKLANEVRPEGGKMATCETCGNDYDKPIVCRNDLDDIL